MNIICVFGHRWLEITNMGPQRKVFGEGYYMLHMCERCFKTKRVDIK